MISKDIIRRVLVEFDADEKKLVEAMEQIEAGNRAMVDQFGASAAAAHKAFDTIGLGAQNQVGRLQKLNNAFQGFTSTLTNGLGAGLGAIDNFSKKLAPWNQALELGGKALRFASEGLDAYAKTSPKAKAEVEALTKEFTKLKSSVMSFVGEAVVALTKPVDFKLLDEMERRFKKFGLNDGVGAFRQGFDDYFSEKARAGRGIDFIFGGGLQKSFADTFRDDWYTGPTPDELLGKVGEKMKEYGAATKKAADEQKKLLEAQRKRHDELMQQMRMALRESVEKREAELEREYAEIRPEMTHDQVGKMMGWTNPSDFADGIGKLPKGAAELKKQENAKYLESMFGPIEDFNAYATAFGMLQTAVTSAMQAWISGSVSGWTAIKKGIGDALGGAATEMMGQGVKHGAYALGSAAFQDYAGAAKHGAASAAFFAGGLTLGAAAKKLGGSVSSDIAASKASAAAADQAAKKEEEKAKAASSSSSGGNGKSGRDIFYVYGDPFADDSPRNRRLTAARAIRRVLPDYGKDA